MITLNENFPTPSESLLIGWYLTSHNITKSTVKIAKQIISNLHQNLHLSSLNVIRKFPKFKIYPNSFSEVIEVGK